MRDLFRFNSFSLIWSWRSRSGGEHCHPTLAVEVRRRRRRRRRTMTTRRTTVADIKSNKPHLTGVEKHIQSPEVTCQIMSGWCGSSHPGAVDVTGAPNSFLQALRHPVECDSWIESKPWRVHCACVEGLQGLSFRWSHPIPFARFRPAKLSLWQLLFGRHRPIPSQTLQSRDW